ncbi:MAG: rod shape-determining protein MreC [bacterium]
MKTKNLISFLIVILAIIVLGTAPIRNLLFNIARPLWSGENFIAKMIGNLGGYLGSKNSLIVENNLFRENASSSQALVALNEVLRTENEQLKSLLERKIIKEQSVLAIVLSKSPVIAYDNLIVDVGSDFGVTVGDRVVADGSTYIGEVSEVYAHESKIKLYSSPGNKLQVFLSKNSLHVEAEGLGNGNFSIKLPKEIDAQEGDPIVIPSISVNIFGIIEKIESRDKDSFQTILFKSPVNLAEISRVEILINK